MVSPGWRYLERESWNKIARREAPLFRDRFVRRQARRKKKLPHPPPPPSSERLLPLETPPSARSGPTIDLASPSRAARNAPIGRNLICGARRSMSVVATQEALPPPEFDDARFCVHAFAPLAPPPVAPFARRRPMDTVAGGSRAQCGTRFGPGGRKRSPVSFFILHNPSPGREPSVSRQSRRAGGTLRISVVDTSKTTFPPLSFALCDDQRLATSAIVKRKG